MVYVLEPRIVKDTIEFDQLMDGGIIEFENEMWIVHTSDVGIKLENVKSGETMIPTTALVYVDFSGSENIEKHKVFGVKLADPRNIVRAKNGRTTRRSKKSSLHKGVKQKRPR
jgi:hypothetical protein